MIDLHAIEQRHTHSVDGLGCEECGGIDWPCDASVLLSLLREARAIAASWETQAQTDLELRREAEAERDTLKTSVTYAAERWVEHQELHAVERDRAVAAEAELREARAERDTMRDALGRIEADCREVGR